LTQVNPRIVPPGTQATRRSLDDLFAEAEKFGLLGVVRHKSIFDGTVYYRAVIEFNTIPGTTLKAQGEATSGPHETLEQAIAKAKQIAGQFR